MFKRIYKIILYIILMMILVTGCSNSKSSSNSSGGGGDNEASSKPVVDINITFVDGEFRVRLVGIEVDAGTDPKLT